MRLTTTFYCVATFTAVLCVPCVRGQSAARRDSARRVLLVPRALEDTMARRFVGAVVAASRQAQSPLQLVPLKHIDATLEHAVIYPAEWHPQDLREMCKLLQATRYVAVAPFANASDDIQLVVGGPRCGAPPVDSLTVPRSLAPAQVLRRLITLLDRQSR